MPAAKKKVSKITLDDVHKALADARFKNCALDQEIVKENQQLLKDIHGKLTYITDEMPVNGYKGLENILRNHHSELKDLKKVTEGVKTTQDLGNAFNRWNKAHPTLHRLFNTGFKKLLWFIGTAIATAVGYEEWFKNLGG